MNHKPGGDVWGWHSIYPAPAKINLFLHVVGRRCDGYHLLQTLFRLLDHGDSLRFTRRSDRQVRLLTPLPGVPPEHDLTVRAARLLQQTTTYTGGVDIVLDKRLPLGGGLGGGSSDAATVLLALNHLWGLGLSRADLQRLGLELGADVPVFVFGRNAFAEGIGEQLQAIDLAPAWYVVLVPPLSVRTADIFAAPEIKRDSPCITVADWYPGFGVNSLQAVACERYPGIAEHLARLAEFAPARMSGSGACVFAAFPAYAEAAAALRQLSPYCQGWLAPGLDQHPLWALAT